MLHVDFETLDILFLCSLASCFLAECHLLEDSAVSEQFILFRQVELAH